MRIGCVIQRYGLEISGGAELHCRLIAEHLAQRHDVDVFTTCAHDYVHWKNYFKAGSEYINRVRVHRFPVKKTRSMYRFIDVQTLAFQGNQPREIEERWIRENGPFCPALIDAVRTRSDVDVWILFSYRYWTTVETLRLVRDRAILVPTAEHDPALHLGVFADLFKLPAAFAYNSIEERNLIQTIAGNRDVPGDVIGVGLPSMSETEVEALKTQFNRYRPYILYIGRIDKNKGCDHLFRYFRRYCDEHSRPINLLLIGSSVLPTPQHPRIHHLGFVSESEKNAALAGAAALIMPSQYESLSMVVLESWRLSRPVLCNRSCEVLEGQCLRSNGGLPYRGYEEFSEALNYIIEHPAIADRIGVQGNRYYQQHYQWPVIEQKYDRLLKLVQQRQRGTHA